MKRSLRIGAGRDKGRGFAPGPNHHGSPIGGGGRGIVGKAHRPEELRQMAALPRAHAHGHIARPILAPCAHFGLQRAQDILDPAQPVAVGVIPCGVKDQRGGGQLCAGQLSLAARGRWAAVIAQPPSSVERHTEQHRAMACQDRLEPQKRGDAIDRARPFEKPLGHDWAVVDRDTLGQGGRVEMARAMARARFGMGLDHDGRAGVILHRMGQHFGKAMGAGRPQPDRRVAARLVDQQHIARWGRFKVGVVCGVFRQMRRCDPRHGTARPVQ